MKNRIILYAVSALMLLSSCEGFLDVKPSNSGDSATSIQNATDAKVFLNGLMRNMASYVYYGRNFVMYGDAKGGDFALRSQGRGLDQLYTFNHAANSNSYSGFWNHLYYCILQANNLIENIERLEQEGKGSATLSNYKGQALTARALIYFDLVRLYGKSYNMDKNSFGVPLELKPVDAKAQPLRASVNEVYTQVLADLEAASSIISKTLANGFLSYYSNRAILARVALTMDDYPTALSAAEEVINSGKFTAYTNANWLASWGKTFGSESIFELAINENEADNGTGSLGYYLLRRDQINGALGFYMASDYFLDRLNQDPTDIRWGLMIPDESSPSRKGSCVKYAGGPDMKGDKGKLSATNVKVIRLSEMYLIAAEASLKISSPNKTKAAEYLNIIRRRSPGLAPATAANITMSMVEDERSKELFAEGHRYFDMLRWNKTITFNDDFIFPVVAIPHRQKTIDRTFYKTILPIPEDEIKANPPIGAQQNPGY